MGLNLRAQSSFVLLFVYVRGFGVNAAQNCSIMSMVRGFLKTPSFQHVREVWMIGTVVFRRRGPHARLLEIALAVHGSITIVFMRVCWKVAQEGHLRPGVVHCGVRSSSGRPNHYAPISKALLPPNAVFPCSF